MNQSLIENLRTCCVQIMGKKPGCGFFIGSKLIVTCAHVVGELDEGFPVKVRDWTSDGIHEIDPQPLLLARFVDDDLALIETHVKHPTFASLHSEIHVGDKLVGVGFPIREETSNSNYLYEFDQFTAEYEGSVDYINASDHSKTELKLKNGQVKPGFSGGPLLNLRTGRVVGIITATRNKNNNLGGWFIGISTLLELCEKKKIQLPEPIINPLKPQRSFAGITNARHNVMQDSHLSQQSERKRLQHCIRLAFSGEDDLRGFCFDHFPDVFCDLRELDRMPYIIRSLISYCESRGLVEHLWELLLQCCPECVEFMEK